MLLFPPTIILRHRKENLKKCSLRGLESRSDMRFFTYPRDSLPDLTPYFLLSLHGPPLSAADQALGVFLIDGTWNHAKTMERQLPHPRSFQLRSLPRHFQTAYPRRQEDCPEPSHGLASLEALFLAYRLLNRPTHGLLDHYYWKEDFLKKNSLDPMALLHNLTP
jgi:pre-rRNA-processing protein TSR3